MDFSTTRLTIQWDEYSKGKFRASYVVWQPHWYTCGQLPKFSGLKYCKGYKTFFQSLGCIPPDPLTTSNYYIKFLEYTCIFWLWYYIYLSSKKLPAKDIDNIFRQQCLHPHFPISYLRLRLSHPNMILFIPSSKQWTQLCIVIWRK